MRFNPWNIVWYVTVICVTYNSSENLSSTKNSLKIRKELGHGIRGWCSDPKGCACKGGGESCNLWNPTSPREANDDMLIRTNLPLMCRGLFLHCYVLWEE